jgi:cytochrome c oxidase assembly factor CtaG
MTPTLGPVTVWRVATTFATGPFAVLTLAGELAALFAYERAVALLALRGRRWPTHRRLAFAGGVAMCALAWQSGIPVYAGRSFTVHVLQHLALMISAPILFALAAPVTLAMQTLPRARKVQLLRALRSRPARLLTNPLVAGLGNYGLMYWFFLDHGIVVAMAHAPLMDLLNCSFLFFGCLVWWPVVSVDFIGRRRYSPALRIVLAATGMPFDSFLAIALLAGGATRSIAPSMYSLSSVQTGAAVFWILVMAVTGLGAAVPVAALFRSEVRRAERSDRLLATSGVVRPVSRYGWWGSEVHLDEHGMMPVPWARPARPAPAGSDPDRARGRHEAPGGDGRGGLEPPRPA